MSEKVSITKNKLDSLANAIAAVGGTSIPKTIAQMESAVLELTIPPIFEDITISQDYLVEQNTVISNGIIFQTDETYPGTPVVLNNAKYANIDNGDLGKNGVGIKIELNRTYHCTGELKIEWSTGEQEIYSIDSDFTPIDYGSNTSLSFSWEGVGTSTQTFNYMNLGSSSTNGYDIFMRPTTGGAMITKSGVLLDGSYYQISVTSDGFNTINLNLSDDPRFQTIYKSLAYRSVIASSAPGVSEWGNSLSTIEMWQFCAQKFSGNFVFNNVSSVGQYAFAVAWIGNGTSIYSPSYTVNFLRSSGTSLGQYTFYNNGMIKEINGPYISIIPSGFCQSCINLTTVSFSECTTITTNAFISCRNLTTVSFPECITIGNNAFSACSNLTTASFPECTSIGSYAFQACNKLTTVSFSKCTTIGSYAFRFCLSLATISFPKCTTINGSAFYNCSSLTTASFPECTSIDAYAFHSCTNLTTISFPECTFIGNYAFSNCSNLTTVSFPKCTSIGSSIFSNCQKLESVYLMGSSIPTLGTGVFNSTPITVSTYLGYFGSIYVPSSLLASYKTATNWATYSNRMVGI